MVDHGSNESAAAETAGTPWLVRDFWRFVQKTYHERDVADVSQIYPRLCPLVKMVGDYSMPGRRGTTVAAKQAKALFD